MTAEEFYTNRVGASPIGYTEEIMVEFAKYHVEKALTEASKVVRWKEQITMQGLDVTISKSSILYAYPLTLIK